MADKRFTIRQEFTGAPTAQWVARFCGDWIGCHDTREGAQELARVFDSDVIHMAHSHSRKHGGNFHVRAYVVRRGIPDGGTIVNDDTREAAEQRALANLRSDYQRLGLAAPEAVVNHGKIAAVFVDACQFHRNAKRKDS